MGEALAVEGGDRISDSNGELDELCRGERLALAVLAECVRAVVFDDQREPTRAGDELDRTVDPIAVERREDRLFAAEASEEVSARALTERALDQHRRAVGERPTAVGDHIPSGMKDAVDVVSRDGEHGRGARIPGPLSIGGETRPGCRVISRQACC